MPEVKQHEQSDVDRGFNHCETTFLQRIRGSKGHGVQTRPDFSHFEMRLIAVSWDSVRTKSSAVAAKALLAAPLLHTQNCSRGNHLRVNFNWGPSDGHHSGGGCMSTHLGDVCSSINIIAS